MVGEHQLLEPGRYVGTVECMERRQTVYRKTKYWRVTLLVDGVRVSMFWPRVHIANVPPFEVGQLVTVCIEHEHFQGRTFCNARKVPAWTCPLV